MLVALDAERRVWDGVRTKIVGGEHDAILELDAHD